MLETKTKSQANVVVLIDEYDAPVTRNMDNKEVAKQNAKILHDFFAILKNEDVSKCIRFTFVTGITRYALTSLDSGANHLVDISLKTEYAGICGFTLEDVQSLFSDRLEMTLSELKLKGQMEKSATIEDLIAKILFWYDGYNWGGETRVLNPYSILNFFYNNFFDNYWITSGRPQHLTSLILEKPNDFLKPKLESYLSQEVRKPDLTGLQAVPVLFHSGYLTVDRTVSTTKINEITNKKEETISYFFRLPNNEVSSSYYNDCFNVIFNRKIDKDFVRELKEKRASLTEAFLTKNAQTVEVILKDLFATLTYHQRMEGEKIYHAYIHLILLIFEFDVYSEIPTSEGRLDLYVRLPDNIFVIIEIKHHQTQNKLTKNEENKLLAQLTIRNIPKDIRDQCLANAVRNKLEVKDYLKFLEGLPQQPQTDAEENHILAQEAMNILTNDEITIALAKLGREKLPKEKLEEVLGPILSKEEIDAILSKDAKAALNQITEKDYHSAVRLKVDKNLEIQSIIDLGLAVYGNGSPVKAIFGE
jgi:hypothetical protein